MDALDLVRRLVHSLLLVLFVRLLLILDLVGGLGLCKNVRTRSKQI